MCRHRPKSNFLKFLEISTSRLQAGVRFGLGDRVAVGCPVVWSATWGTQHMGHGWAYIPEVYTCHITSYHVMSCHIMFCPGFDLFIVNPKIWVYVLRHRCWSAGKNWRKVGNTTVEISWYVAFFLPGCKPILTTSYFWEQFREATGVTFSSKVWKVLKSWATMRGTSGRRCGRSAGRFLGWFSKDHLLSSFQEIIVVGGFVHITCIFHLKFGMM